MTDESKDLRILMCAPLKDYPEKPKDYSESTIIECPKCSEKMWFTEKKKNLVDEFKSSKLDYLLCCFDCLRKIVEKDKSFFKNTFQVNI